MHPHVEEWDRYWKDKSIKKRMIEFVRRNYFSKIFISEILKNVQTSDSLLEAGCGSGTYLQMIQSENKDIFCVGIDNSKESVKIAIDKNVEIVLGDIFNLPFKDKTFKVAFNQGVMEHFNDNEFRKILKELARVAENVLILKK